MTLLSVHDTFKERKESWQKNENSWKGSQKVHAKGQKQKTKR